MKPEEIKSIAKVIENWVNYPLVGWSLGFSMLMAYVGALMGIGKHHSTPPFIWQICWIIPAIATVNYIIYRVRHRVELTRSAKQRMIEQHQREIDRLERDLL